MFSSLLATQVEGVGRASVPTFSITLLTNYPTFLTIADDGEKVEKKEKKLSPYVYSIP